MNNNYLTKVTYTITGAIYETYNVESLRDEISKLYDDFRDNKIKEILSANDELFSKYFPEEGEPDEYFPMVMIHPVYLLEYEIRFNSTSFKEHPLLLKIIEKEIAKVQSNIVNRWRQGLVEIGYLNNPE